jgi:mRNA-degrading endonuclease RelE of RelBE toxin-antitoxin system
MSVAAFLPGTASALSMQTVILQYEVKRSKPLPRAGQDDWDLQRSRHALQGLGQKSPQAAHPRGALRHHLVGCMAAAATQTWSELRARVAPRPTDPEVVPAASLLRGALAPASLECPPFPVNRIIADQIPAYSTPGAAMDELGSFSPEELVSIQLGLEEIRTGRVVFTPPARAIGIMMAAWGRSAAALTPGESRSEDGENSLEIPRVLADLQMGQAKLPEGGPWSMAMTEEFSAASRDVGLALRRAILEAIAHISLMPTLPMGTTVKPLTGMLNGLWRYRLGNTRLVYRPNSAEKRLVLVTLVPRGGVR